MRCLRPSLPLVLLGLAACADPVQGELRISNAGGSELHLAPQECFDGAPLGFLGVQLRDDDRTVEFFDDGGQPALIVHIPGDVAFELIPADCATFAGALDREFNRRTDVGKVSGDVTVDCTSLDGWSVQGELSFEECWAEEEEECDDDF